MHIMKSNPSYELWKLILPQKNQRSLAVIASFLICLLTNAGMAQVTTSPASEREPIDPAREKQKEAYFKNLEVGQSTTVEEQKVQDEFSAEPLPNLMDTGDFEADKAAYLLAVKGWLERNASFYSKEELEFLTKPILSPEEKQRNLNKN